MILTFLVFAMLISLFGFASASCANENQTILKISSDENAHGALWDRTSGIKICYDDYFREFKGANAHVCSSANVLIKLSNTNNSHAAPKDSSIYNVKVCHNGLSNCTVHAGQNCTRGKKAIVYLSNLSNAHISKTYVQGFYAVCCSNITVQARISESIVHCMDYTTQNSCNNYDYFVAQTGCPNGKECYCNWNSTGRKCIQSYNNLIGNCNYKCNLAVAGRTEECDANEMRTISVDAQIIPVSGDCTGITDPECVDKEIEIPCGLLVGADLPFFGFWQIATSLISITLIYLILLRKRA